jgi:Zn-dependent protease
MVSIETLRALIALEWAVILRWLLGVRVTAIHLLHACSMPTIESWHHAILHIPNQGHLATGTVQIRHDGTTHCWQ